MPMRHSRSVQDKTRLLRLFSGEFHFHDGILRRAGLYIIKMLSCIQTFKFSTHAGLNLFHCSRTTALLMQVRPFPNEALFGNLGIWKNRKFPLHPSLLQLKQNGRLGQLKLDQKLKAVIPWHWLGSQFSHSVDPNPHLVPTLTYADDYSRFI